MARLLVTAVGTGVLVISSAVAAGAVAASAAGAQAARSPGSATVDTPGVFLGVSCPGAAACTAVGGTPAEASLAERWNGTVWAVQPTPAVGTLSAVSCPSKTACTALGGPAGALAWNGKSWARQSVPIPRANGSGLTAVSCTAATACTAVGYYYTSDQLQQLLWVGRWNGTAWASQSVPSPATTAAFKSEAFEGVSCFSAGACVAVGYYKNTQTSTIPLIETWNGTAWTIQPSPASFAAPFNALYGVSCSSAGACTAVGTSYTSGSYEPLAESRTGTAWTLQPTPAPHGGNLTSVSCTSTTACTATGYYVDSAGGFAALADRWNGTTWAIQSIAQPPSGWTPLFAGVSCTSVTACTAAGDRYRQDGTRLTLAEHWNGTTWAIQRT